MTAVAAVAVLATVACGNFESPTVVIDLRVLGVTIEPPEVVVDANPDEVSLADIPDVEVCALVADPFESRSLSYSLRACSRRDGLRCDEDRPFADITDGTVDDPEEADAPVSMCGTLGASGDLLLVLMDAVRIDDLAGFGGVGVQVELRVDAPGVAELASKEMRYSARLPEERVANANPTLDAIVGLREANGQRNRDFDVPLGRCKDVEPFEVLAGEDISLLPRETEGTREDYLVPTFDGGSREFSETLTYRWFATHGKWRSTETGGPRDLAGNAPRLDNTWAAPTDPDIVGAGLDVALWVVVRDERAGLAWYETCAHVSP